MCFHGRQQFLSTITSKFPLQPGFQMGSDSNFIHFIDVPRHIQEKFYLIFRRFDITHIQHPHLLNATVVSQLHLLMEQIRAESSQPKIIVRTAPVRYIVINTVASFAGTPFRCREVTDIPVIIITPDQRYIIRHL